MTIHPLPTRPADAPYWQLRELYASRRAMVHQLADLEERIALAELELRSAASPNGTAQQEGDGREWWTRQEAADWLRCTPSHVTQLADRGRIYREWSGSRPRFRPESVRAYMDSGRRRKRIDRSTDR